MRRLAILWVTALVVTAGVVGVVIGEQMGDDVDRVGPRSTTTRPTTTTSTTRPALRPAFDTCTLDQLDAGYGGIDGAVGWIDWTFVVVNRGEPCSLQGWPSVILHDADGHELPVRVGQHLAAEAGPVDLFATELPFVVHDAPVVEAARVVIETATDRGEVPGMVTYAVAEVAIRLPGVAGELRTAAPEGMTVAQHVLVHPLAGPRGTIRD